MLPLFHVSLRNVAMGTSTAWARVSAFASAYAPLLVSVRVICIKYIDESISLIRMTFDSKDSKFGSLRVPKIQIFVEMFCANLQSPVWSHVGGALCSTNMVAGK